MTSAARGNGWRRCGEVKAAGYLVAHRRSSDRDVNVFRKLCSRAINLSCLNVNILTTLTPIAYLPPSRLDA